MKTTQDQFHPILGHVDDGVEIEMRNGHTLTLRATMRGWQLFNGKQACSEPTANAYVVASLVQAYA